MRARGPEVEGPEERGREREGAEGDRRILRNSAALGVRSCPSPGLLGPGREGPEERGLGREMTRKRGLGREDSEERTRKREDSEERTRKRGLEREGSEERGLGREDSEERTLLLSEPRALSGPDPETSSGPPPSHTIAAPETTAGPARARPGPATRRRAVSMRGCRKASEASFLRDRAIAGFATASGFRDRRDAKRRDRARLRGRRRQRETPRTRKVSPWPPSRNATIAQGSAPRGFATARASPRTPGPGPALRRSHGGHGTRTGPRSALGGGARAGRSGRRP